MVGIQGRSAPPRLKTSTPQRNMAESRGGMMCDPTSHAKKQCLSYTWKRIRGNQNDARFSSDLQTGMQSMDGDALKATAKEDKTGLRRDCLKTGL